MSNLYIVRKFLYQVGEHYRDDRELFYLLQGQATFDLLNVDNASQRENYVLNPGGRLLIPARVAHKVQVQQDAIFIGCTEKPYVSAAVNDLRYDF